MGTFRVIIIVILFAVTTTTIWFHSSYAHITDSEKIQVWTNPKDNVKIQFSYSPEMPIIDTFTSLNFSVQDLQSGDHIRDFTARVVVTNGERLANLKILLFQMDIFRQVHFLTTALTKFC